MDLLICEVRLDNAEAIIYILNPIIEAGLYTVLDTPLTVEAERGYITSFPQRGVFYNEVLPRMAKERSTIYD